MSTTAYHWKVRGQNRTDRKPVHVPDGEDARDWIARAWGVPVADVEIIAPPSVGTVTVTGGLDLTGRQGYLGDLDDCRIDLRADGSATLSWGDGVANAWEETFADLPTAVLRLAALLQCGETDWVAGLSCSPERFADLGARFLAEVVS
jgi:hypothetical protein